MPLGDLLLAARVQTMAICFCLKSLSLSLPLSLLLPPSRYSCLPPSLTLFSHACVHIHTILPSHFLYIFIRAKEIRTSWQFVHRIIRKPSLYNAPGLTRPHSIFKYALASISFHYSYSLTPPPLFLPSPFPFHLLS
jgi:hypothetical protein